MSVPRKPHQLNHNLEFLGERIVPDGTAPIAIDDSAGFPATATSSPIDVLSNDIDNNPGATWDYATLTVVTPPQGGLLTVDTTTGEFLYTPNNLLPPGRKLPPAVGSDSFTYHVSNSLGLQSNTATVTLTPTTGPGMGFITPSDDMGFTNSMRSVMINLLANDTVFGPGHIDPASVKIHVPVPLPPLPSLPGIPPPPPLPTIDPNPQHGTVTFDPLTGAATYTPDFGYVGWDRFDYQVTAIPDPTYVPLPNDLFTVSARVYVLIERTAPRLQADPEGGQMVIVDGTPGADAIQILRGDRRHEVKALVNGVLSPSLKPSRIVVFGYEGNDVISVDPQVSRNVWLVGGMGNDRLQAGGGATLMMGNQGNDTLSGGKERDVLSGGDGMDQLFGRQANDLLVGGSTDFDHDPNELASIFDTWQEQSRWWGRWWHGWGWWATHWNNGAVLTSDDMNDDQAPDTLRGGRGHDRIFATAIDDIFRSESITSSSLLRRIHR